MLEWVESASRLDAWGKASAKRVRALLSGDNPAGQAIKDGQVVKTSIHTALTHLVAPSVLEKEIEAAGLKVVGRHDVVSGYEILKASSHPVAVRLIEISH